MLPSNDVIDLVAQNRGRLREQAILTGVASTVLDQLSGLSGNFHEAARTDKNASAWSLRTLSISFSRTISAYSSLSSGVSRPSVLLCASSSTRGERSLPTASRAAS